jgi:hypothetical protein
MLSSAQHASFRTAQHSQTLLLVVPADSSQTHSGSSSIWQGSDWLQQRLRCLHLPARFLAIKGQQQQQQQTLYQVYQWRQKMKQATRLCR